ncbi:unnamed protein product [Prorocentrum cordatum]|uniref:Uncharacterized protein n=1 Tax=Prorocentrum cordatum TaxID=2364126 RepID=A0ABN9SQ22_9DINO|nr:unnamed protein product [Polarella glacialis]
MTGAGAAGSVDGQMARVEDFSSPSQRESASPQKQQWLGGILPSPGADEEWFREVLTSNGQLANVATKNDIDDMKTSIHAAEVKIEGFSSRLSGLEAKSAASSAAARELCVEEVSRIANIETVKAQLKTNSEATRSTPPSGASSVAGYDVGGDVGGNNNSCNIWIAGFPRPVLASAMTRHAIQRYAPHSVAAIPKCHIFFQSAYSIVFDSIENAKDFLTRDRTLDVTWDGPSQIQSVTLKVRTDAPPEIRKVNRVLGALGEGAGGCPQCVSVGNTDAMSVDPERRHARAC